MKFSIRVLLALSVFFLSTLHSIGQTSWTGGAYTTNWATAGNWTNGVPTASMDAIIGDRSLSREPTISGAAVCKSLTIGNGSYSGILTVSANLTVHGNVNIETTGTLTQNSSTLTLYGTWSNSGTYTGASTSSNVVFAGGTQNVSGSIVTNFRTLTINSGSTLELSKNMNVDVSITINGTFDPNEAPYYQLNGGAALTVGSTGTIKVNGATPSTNYGSLGIITFNAGSTVDYSSTTTDQDIYTGFSYSTLKISGSGTKSISGSLSTFQSSGSTVGNILVTGGTLDLGAYTANRGATVSGGTLSVSNGAKLIIGGANGLPSNYATRTFGATSTVEYNGTGQVITPATYGNLTLSGIGSSSIAGGTTVAAAGDFLMSGGAFYVSNGAGTSTLNVTGNFTQTGGITYVSNSTGTGALTISGDASISGGTFDMINYATAPSTTVNIAGDLAISSSGKINLESISSSSGVAVINVNGNFSSTGTSVATSGRGGGVIDFGTGTITNNAINIKGNFTKSGIGTFGTTTTTATPKGFIFGGTSTQTFTYSGASSYFTIYTINAGASLQMLSGLSLLAGTTPRSTFTVNGTIDMGVNVISATTNPTFTLTASGKMITANTGGVTAGLTGSWSAKTFTSGADYEFNSSVANQTFGFSGLTIPTPGTITVSNTGGTVTADISVTFGNSGALIVNSGSELNAAALLFAFGTVGTVTINGTLYTSNTNGFSGATTTTIKSTNTPTISLGTSSTIEYNGSGTQTITATNYNNLTSSNAGARTLPSSGTIGIAGAFAPGTNAYTINGSTISFNGATAQNIPAFTFNNLTISNTAGTTLTGNATVNSVLTFTNGLITTNANTLSLASGATITGQAAGKYVNGKLLWNIPTGAQTRTFTIGDATNYTPVTIAFSNVTTAGNLTVSTTATDHPNLASATISATKSVNRYWTLANSSIVFTTVAITPTWVAGDLDAGVTTTNFKAGIYNGGWIFPAVTAPLPTSIQATGVTSLGDFAVGEGCNLTSTFTYGVTPFCKGGGTASPSMSGTAGTFTSTAGLTINSTTGVITLSTSTPGTYTVTNSVTSGSCSSTSTAAITITAISNNQIDYTNGTHGVLCSTAGENGSVVLTAPAGNVFTTVGFASYGTPAGSCSAFTIGNCHAVTSQAIAESYLLGNNTATIPATNTVFGDPCSGTGKQLYVQATYTQPICSGTAPGTITGTTPTGGNGTYTYLWEKSTTSSSTGFATATGTSNAKDYTPGTLTQTTWYRRTVISNGCSDISAVIQVTVTPVPAATIAYDASSFCVTAGTAAVTRNGTAGGTYTSTAGLTINSTTGDITLASSTPGAYTVTYTMVSGGCTSTATASVTVNQIPTTANAGADQVGIGTCGLTTVTLAANTPSVGTGTWSIISGTSGTVTTPTSPTSTFSGVAGSTYVLRWTISNNPCAVSTDDVTITFNRAPTTANAGADQLSSATCGLTTVTLAANTPSIGTGAWIIISGSGGTVATPASPTSTFSGTAGSTYILRWTISNSPCTASTDDVTITFNQNPSTANAGPDQVSSATCGLTTVTLAGNAGSGSWNIISGTGGTVANLASPTSTFSGAAGSTYVLRWTLSSGPCALSTDDVTITFNRAPTTANAGPDQLSSATCGLTTVTLAANTPSIGTGAWIIISGTGGTVANLASPTSTFSGVAGNTYVLRWTISNSPCAASTDDVTITLNQVPTAGISYPGTPFCKSVATAQPVSQSGTAGGTYSSTAGLTINASTGAITPSTSTAGTYTVTYSFSNGTCSNTTTASVVISTAPLATIAYTGSPYSALGGTASVLFNGTTGGVYSSTAGLTLNASTGAVTLLTSLAGTYTVTYTVAASGGCSVYTTTASITIGSSSTKYYVNDNSRTGDVYTSAVGSNSNAGTIAAPYLTINYAVSHANAGDTIYVDAGTYGEQVDANKRITILGANAAISPNTGTRVAESILYNTSGNSITITTTSRVVIKGFRITTTYADAVSANTFNHKVTLEKMFFDGCSNSSYFSSDTLILADNRFNNVVNGGDKSVFIQGNYNGLTGSYIQVYNNTWINSGSGGMNISSARGDIYNNTFSNIAYLGILVANYSSLNITRNVFTNITNPDVSVNTWGAGVRFYTPSVGMITNITNNFFTNNYVGIAVRPTDDVTGKIITISNNSFSGNTFASINHTGAGLLQATCNWFGSSNSGVFSSSILGNVNYGPFLTIGTDNDLVTAGFQPIAGNCAGYLTRWTGATNNLWALATNWTNGVPNASFDVVIPSGLTVYPVIGVGIAAVNNLTVQTGASLSLTTTLKIKGSITNSGSISASTGTIYMNGSTSQVIPAGAFTGNTIYEFNVDNAAGVTLAGPLNIISILRISDGVLTTGNYLTLKSSAANTARVSTITSNAANPIVGNVTVERYVQGRRKYRLITSSVTTSTSSTLVAGQESQSIWGNWQNAGSNATANVGTIITGGSAINGFDVQTSSASLYTYNAATKKFVGYTTANGMNTKYTPLIAGVPYYMFVYGDRTNSITTSTPNNTVLKATGTLLTGDQKFSTTSAIPLNNTVGTYTLIGNPYAAIIDWKSINKKNVSKTIWGWDANLNSTGGYVTVTATTNGALIAPLSDKIKVNQYVQPGQAFFVQTTNASPVITITEADKVDDDININSTVFRTSGVTKQPLVAVNLLYTTSGNTTLADGAVAAFDAGFSKLVDDEDALKMVNTTEGVAITNGSDLLSIDARPAPVANDTILINLSKLTRLQYTLQVFTKDMDASNVLPYLEDSYLHTTKSLVLNDTNSVVFSVIPGDAASSDMNRFRIVFRQLTSLPVKFTSIKATQKDNNILVDWSVSEESSIQKYEVQKSVDGINFTKGGDVATTGNNNIAAYNWLDINTVTGYNYYRVRGIQANGETFLSKIVSASIDATGKSAMSVYPNPVKNNQITLHLDQMEKGDYILQLISMQGLVVFNRVISHAGGSSNQNIPLDKKLTSGVYYLKISNQNKKKAYGQNLIIE